MFASQIGRNPNIEGQLLILSIARADQVQILDEQQFLRRF